MHHEYFASWIHSYCINEHMHHRSLWVTRLECAKSVKDKVEQGTNPTWVRGPVGPGFWGFRVGGFGVGGVRGWRIRGWGVRWVQTIITYYPICWRVKSLFLRRLVGWAGRPVWCGVALHPSLGLDHSWRSPCRRPHSRSP